MRRLFTAVAIVLIALTPVLGFTDEARAQTGYVTWTVDHHAKTITVNAKLAIYDTACAPTADGAGTSGDCSMSMDRIAREIRTDIESVWNDAARGGRHYKCYRLIFKADIIVVGGRSSVPSDRLAVRIDRSTQGFRSKVRTTVGSGTRSDLTGNYLSNQPDDRIEPSDSLRPSEFSYPAIGRHDYAHEYGHIIGLDEYYDRDTGQLRPGAPDDLMFDENRSTIAQETIDRAVERNRDRLRDRQGRPVDLDDLVCDLRYKATLKATDLDYSASNVRYQMTGPGCDPPSVVTVSSSTQQSLSVVSRPVVLYVLDAPNVAFLEYSLAPIPDELRNLWGIAEQFLQSPTETAFAVPVTIRVSRDTHSPARGERPPLLTSESDACSENEGRSPPPNDCGTRSFDAWMALLQQGIDELWTGDAPVPLHLRDLGTNSSRESRLYRNCPGPNPWPGSFVDDRAAVVFKGKLPIKVELERVAREWTGDHKPGRFDIKGVARLNTSEPGRLRNRSYTWTLTLCPMDKDGNTPPLCP